MIQTLLTRNGKTYNVIKKDSKTITYIVLDIKNGKTRKVHSIIKPSDKIDKINIL